MAVDASGRLPVWRDFEPKDDITVKELSDVVAALGVAIAAPVFETLPQGAKRHFSTPWIK